ncbi:MAG: 6-phosphogluconolactonase [Gammaproteobacteria bacterium]|nr:6-phosphogluconolactonase [Gammaproteobacteria bacterium]
MSEKNLLQNDSAAIQAEALAADIAGRLSDAIDARGSARIAFSGGSTPHLMLAELAQLPVDWNAVEITLVDERCVAEDDERSNAGMLRSALLAKPGVQATFVPLFKPDESDAERAARLDAFTLPFDVVHLGMGGDAHTASFFPDAPNIDEMLDLQQPHRVMITQSASSREQRLTWSLRALLQTRYFVLQLVGEEKRAVLEQVLVALGSATIDERQRRELPVLAFLEETELKKPDGVPGRVYCAVER